MDNTMIREEMEVEAGEVEGEVRILARAGGLRLMQ